MIFDDKEFIAKKIRMARKEAKLTQENLAELVGITSQQLSRIEMATYIPSLPTFLKIVKILKIDMSDFGLTNNKAEIGKRKDFLKLIYTFSESELEYYYKILKTMVDNSKLLK